MCSVKDSSLKATIRCDDSDKDSFSWQLTKPVYYWLFTPDTVAWFSPCKADCELQLSLVFNLQEVFS